MRARVASAKEFGLRVATAGVCIKTGHDGGDEYENFVIKLLLCALHVLRPLILSSL